MTLDLCGDLRAFTAASAAGAASAAAGACNVAGVPLSIASGTAIAGDVLAKLGANVCLHATVDASGSVVAPSSLTAELLASASLHACGVVRAYVAAGADATGTLAIGAPSFTLAAGASVAGAAALSVGASVCVDASLDASGHIAACTVHAN